MPAIGVALKAGGTIEISANFDSSDQNTLSVTISGDLYAKAEVTAGWDQVASVSAGAKGTVVSASLTGGVSNSGITRSGKLSAGSVSVYVDGKLLSHDIFNYNWEVYSGWSASF